MPQWLILPVVVITTTCNQHPSNRCTGRARSHTAPGKASIIARRLDSCLPRPFRDWRRNALYTVHPTRQYTNPKDNLCMKHSVLGIRFGRSTRSTLRRTKVRIRQTLQCEGRYQPYKAPVLTRWVQLIAADPTRSDQPKSPSCFVLNAIGTCVSTPNLQQTLATPPSPDPIASRALELNWTVSTQTRTRTARRDHTTRRLKPEPEWAS